MEFFSYAIIDSEFLQSVEYGVGFAREWRDLAGAEMPHFSGAETPHLAGGKMPDLVGGEKSGLERRFSRFFAADFVLLRDKTAPDYPTLARRFARLARQGRAAGAFKKSAKFLLHNDAALAFALGFDGVHFSGQNAAKIQPARAAAAEFFAQNPPPNLPQDAAQNMLQNPAQNTAQNVLQNPADNPPNSNLARECAGRRFFIIYSAHTQGEIARALALGADFATFSPLFFSAGKGAPLGLDAFAAAAKCHPARIIALGGIDSDEKVRAIAQNTAAAGFAAISYFRG